MLGGWHVGSICEKKNNSRMFPTYVYLRMCVLFTYPIPHLILSFITLPPQTHQGTLGPILCGKRSSEAICWLTELYKSIQHAAMQPAYVECLEAENMMLRARLAKLGIPMKVLLAEPAAAPQVHRHRRKSSNVYTGILRVCRATKVKTVCADGKTYADRLAEAADQLGAAGVSISGDATLGEVVELYLKASAELQKAVRIYSASILVPDVLAMTNDAKIALANTCKTQIKAAVAHLDEARANATCSMLMKAIVHHLDITKKPS